MSLRRAWLTYTFGRLALFVVSAVLIWGASGLAGHQISGLALLLAALIVSSVLALALLRGQREAFAHAIQSSREEKAAAAAARRARLDDSPPA